VETGPAAHTHPELLLLLLLCAAAATPPKQPGACCMYEQHSQQRRLLWTSKRCVCLGSPDWLRLLAAHSKEKAGSVQQQRHDPHSLAVVLT
jgi:hypothetical protein